MKSFLGFLLAMWGFCFSSWAQSQNIHWDMLTRYESPSPWIKHRYPDLLQQMPHHAVVIEVGVQKGTFAAYILKETKPKQLYLIDCWKHQDPKIYNDIANIVDDEQEKLYQELCQLYKKNSRVHILRQFSQDAVNQFENESIDWVYLDANHSYDSVKNDIALWWPKIKKGGFLSGHDYIELPIFGVVQAVNEFLRDNNLFFSYLTTEDQYDSWAIQKLNE